MKRTRWIALLLALLLLGGCAAPAEAEPETDSQTETTDPAEPQETEADTAEPETVKPFALAWETDKGFNPYSCTVLSNRTVLSLLYEPLFTVDSAFQASPYLCESMTSSGDGRTHTLTLRQGVTFSDGTALMAADVVASINAARSGAYYGSRLSMITSVAAASDTTVTITTDSACGTLASLLNIYVVKSGTVGETAPVGTGPYRFDGTQLVRTDWWRDETPAVDEESIALVAVTTAADIRDQFEYGNITVACVDPNSGQQLTYHTDYELWNNNTTILQYVGFNLSSPVFVYSSLRSAVTRALDRDAIVSDTAGGFGAAAVLPASPYSSRYDQNLAAAYGYDTEAFQSILAASDVADHTGGDGILEVFTEDGTQSLTGTLIVSDTSDQRVAAANAVAAALNAQGFSLTVEALEYDDYVTALQNGNYDLYYGEVRLSPDFDLSVFFGENAALGYGGITDSALALLCAQARENEGNAYNLYEKVMERGVLCPVLFKTYAVYSQRGRVTGLTPCLDGVFLQPIPEKKP